ncbi:MAG TPA: hypothetical protein DCY79_22245 [Planctomycetaceae bacterium]|nr:hypothetical protein [Planctomycetaceae bacterium]|tara:strand:- start:140 stop:763 length:624 start_codon:yes stop_codon:yes gene_type:complete
MKTDGQIVAETMAGQPDLFAQLVVRYQPSLTHVAKLRLGRSEGAEEVVQETFYWAYKCLARYDSRYSFRTWLWTILLNQCKRFHSKQRRVPRVTAWTDHGNELSRDDDRHSPDPTPAMQLLMKERDELLYHQLAQLAEDEADAIRLRFFGGLKFQEIADAMGCSLSCAKTRVKRGLVRLSQQLTHPATGTRSEPTGNSQDGGTPDAL